MVRAGDAMAVFFLDDAAKDGAESLDGAGTGLPVGPGDTSALVFGQATLKLGALGSQVKAAAAAVGVVGTLVD